MSNTVQYRYFHKGDNEWLSEPHPDDTEENQEAWNEEWAEIRKEHGDIKVDFTEEMYTNSEYGDTPEWVNVVIGDSGVLPLKMARGIIGALDGCRAISFDRHFDLVVSSEWGGWSMARLEVYSGGAYITISAKHSSEELELNITEQFNQAIGETA